MIGEHENKAIMGDDMKNKEKKTKKTVKRKAFFKVPIHFDGKVRHGPMELTEEQYKQLEQNNFVKQGKILLDK